MKARPVRGWFALDLPDDWRATGDGRWESPRGGLLEARELLCAATPVDADALVESHEDWCRDEGLHAHEIRIELLPSGVLMVRSYGETRADAFLMAGHFSWNGRLVRLSFRCGLERLRDEDLAEVLAAFLEFQPSETST